MQEPKPYLPGVIVGLVIMTVVSFGSMFALSYPSSGVVALISVILGFGIVAVSNDSSTPPGGFGER